MEGSAEWSATGVEYRGVFIARGFDSSAFRSIRDGVMAAQRLPNPLVRVQILVAGPTLLRCSRLHTSVVTRKTRFKSVRELHTRVAQMEEARHSNRRG